MKSEEVVGHVPRLLSCIVSLFLRRGGSVTCRVSGYRQYSSDLPQGGLEIPCIYTFSGQEDLISRSVRRLNDLKMEVQRPTRMKDDSESDAEGSE